MVKLLLIPGVLMLSCGATKNSKELAKSDSVIVTTPFEKTKRDSMSDKTSAYTSVPACIKNKTDSFKLKEDYEKPQKVFEYNYKGKTVFYVVMPCCDFFNEVFDDKCNYLGAPDGGFTGKGDGKLPDFFEKAKVVKLIWQAAK